MTYIKQVEKVIERINQSIFSMKPERLRAVVVFDEDYYRPYVTETRMVPLHSLFKFGNL